MFLLSLFACLNSVQLSESDETTSSDLSNPENLAPASYVPSTLQLGFLYGAEGWVELRPYHDADGMMRVGKALVHQDIEGGAMGLSLPFEAPRRDRPNPTDPVVYAIAIRADDGAGRPGLYTGLSDIELVWLATDSDGGVAGWNVARGFGTDDVEWLDITAIQHIGENLRGERSLSLHGSTAIVTTDVTRLRFSAGDEEGDASTWDEAIATEWASVLPDMPNREAVESYDGVNGAMFSALTYEDEDGDGVRTTEPWTGEVCAGAVPVVATWFAPVRSLPAARVMRDNHYVAGWSAYVELEDGLVPLAEGVYLAVRPF